MGDAFSSQTLLFPWDRPLLPWGHLLGTFCPPAHRRPRGSALGLPRAGGQHVRTSVGRPCPCQASTCSVCQIHQALFRGSARLWPRQSLGCLATRGSESEPPWPGAVPLTPPPQDTQTLTLPSPPFPLWRVNVWVRGWAGGNFNPRDGCSSVFSWSSPSFYWIGRDEEAPGGAGSQGLKAKAGRGQDELLPPDLPVSCGKVPGGGGGALRGGVGDGGGETEWKAGGKDGTQGCLCRLRYGPPGSAVKKLPVPSFLLLHSTRALSPIRSNPRSCDNHQLTPWVTSNTLGDS